MKHDYLLPFGSTAMVNFPSHLIPNTCSGVPEAMHDVVQLVLNRVQKRRPLNVPSTYLVGKTPIFEFTLNSSPHFATSRKPLQVQ